MQSDVWWLNFFDVDDDEEIAEHLMLNKIIKEYKRRKERANKLNSRQKFDLLKAGQFWLFSRPEDL